ncbi:MAG TPA: peptidylprolyl isomerase [Dehalococcoidia bacterium]|nr:peptidylprolyl isomerase [Dehalococcoidia bacterium]
MMNRQPANRRARRRAPRSYTDVRRAELPGLLGVITNPKVFVVAMVVMGLSMLLSVLPLGIGGAQPTDDGQIHQAGELEDKPIVSADETPQPQVSTTPTVKRYDSPPSLHIDPSKRYVATVKTSKGDFQIELDPSQAPETVNSFVFLAREGYYNNTPFMQLARDQSGGKFVAQAGDPTCKPGVLCQALGTPGYSIRKETTSLPFSRGAVGMGGSSPTSNGGQFFISFGDYPALNGKYTIFGRVISGMDVVDRLTLLDLTQGEPGPADTIISVEIAES